MHPHLVLVAVALPQRHSLSRAIAVAVAAVVVVPVHAATKTLEPFVAHQPLDFVADSFSAVDHAMAATRFEVFK